MDAQRLDDAVRTFLESYNKAFASIDGARIAALYHSPCVTMRGDGSIHRLTSDDLAAYLQNVADTYHREGYRDGRFKIVLVVPIGGRSALVTVDWELLRGDGSVIRGWRQSYNLVRVKAAWQILVSTFHVG
jgi:ketosteroid isomerase-like protein